MWKKLMLLTTLLAPVLPAQVREGTSGVIGRMDSVEIRVFREEELTTRGQLSSDGTISMPLIGAVRIEGLTTDQAAAAISRRLKDGYLVRPEVSVAIEARIRRTVTILGQAQRPGVFEIPAHRRLTLVEVVGMAGGTTRIANEKKVTLKRGGQVFSVNLRDITNGKGEDIALRDGDTITIPESLF
ncbi:polysaccharide export protein [Luteolibacter sp. SL250]|uniref:polysaccharide biosynthesis/export family protein n=1 Tax=Luteolibacter sp. SL250 TaxID=2995170 RepID=UPI002270D294|nr:polysaccharide biosynthesis/export family protein [Luteolibacter sp. SL250]WAC19369.1 polysaccharide export protein [Luteolibacter sp. SL250]